MLIRHAPALILFLAPVYLLSHHCCMAASTTATVTAAARVLDQSTFGPTLSDIQHVEQIGIQNYITEQLGAAPTSLTDIPAPAPSSCSSDPGYCLSSDFWSNSLNAKDQLRQRVAFALSEVWVTSTTTVSAYAALTYYNLLIQDSFGNYRTLMGDISRSTAMGNYLNMLNSAKPPAGQIANENYARELLQLFTIGTTKLQRDGTAEYDSKGAPVPEYSEAQVQAFARAFTGWTYAGPNGLQPLAFSATPQYASPMMPVENSHDTSSKTLLHGEILPAGQSAAQDLNEALDNIFADDNVPPFVSRQLIQHLVTSTPSAAYVSRVSAVFMNDGSGTRGNLAAVIRAILLDPEARAGDTVPDYDGGHLREPILYCAEVMRALGYVSQSPANLWNYQSLSNYTRPVAQVPLYEPSVFSFYPTGYVVPGTALNAPEFGIENTGTTIDRLTLADQLVSNHEPSVFSFYPTGYVVPGTALNAPEFGIENTGTTIDRLTLADQLVSNHVYAYSVDLSATSPLGIVAKASTGNLVDTLGLIFLHGQMPAQMRSTILDAVTPIKDAGTRVQVAVYLVITSSEYKILH